MTTQYKARFFIPNFDAPGMLTLRVVLESKGQALEAFLKRCKVFAATHNYQYHIEQLIQSSGVQQ